MSKPDLDEMMKNDKTDNFNTMHLKDFVNARLEIQKVEIPQNGHNKHHNYKYTELEDMINVVEPILLKHNLISNFTQVYDEETLEGTVSARIKFRMRITHAINRQYFQSEVSIYHNREIKKIGEHMTYARRYLYESILLIRGTPDSDSIDDSTGAFNE